ncbi:MAG TPA: PfkB family carbohydrate kinase [Stellaceae bacterium]|nr:PfkB family carbohydrate kinase [Stellaceae bacterium]
MILVFGSINIDLIVPVPRWPSPGETVLGGDYVLQPGGKGANQALAARRAGAAVGMAGAVGDDGFAEAALAGLRAAGVELDLIRVGRRPTGCAAIIVNAAGENLIAVSSGANAEAAAAQVPDAALAATTTLLLQMEVPAAENAALSWRARRHGARVVLNLAPAAPLDPALLDDIDLLLVNEGEAAALDAEPAALARRLRQGIVITRGADGAAALLSDGRELAAPALPVTPVDTTGAGDTFAGVLAAALDSGRDLAAALRCACAAASLACLARGAQAGMPDAAAIEAAATRLAS